MIAFIKKHEGWFDFVVFGSSSALLFIYTPFPLIQSLAQSPFFYFLGPAAGPGANLMLSTIGGSVALLSLKGLGVCMKQIHEQHQAHTVYPEELTGAVAFTQNHRLFPAEQPDEEQVDDGERLSESNCGAKK
jgi:hypothetical protein